MQGVSGRNSAEPEQGRRHGNVGLLDELQQQRRGSGRHHAVARQDDGASGRREHLEGLLDVLTGRVIGGAIAGQGDRLVGPLERALVLLGVFGDVDDDRPGAARAGDIKGFPDRRGHVLDAGHEIVVLGDGQGHARDVRLLEGVGAK